MSVTNSLRSSTQSWYQQQLERNSQSSRASQQSINPHYTNSAPLSLSTRSLSSPNQAGRSLPNAEKRSAVGKSIGNAVVAVGKSIGNAVVAVGKSIGNAVVAVGKAKSFLFLTAISVAWFTCHAFFGGIVLAIGANPPAVVSMLATVGIVCAGVVALGVALGIAEATCKAIYKAIKSCRES